MKSKDFSTTLAASLKLSLKETNQLTNKLLECMTQHWEDEDIIAISSFGSFEVKKKMERVLINPQTKQRMLVPPKLSLTFKPTTSLKNEAK